MNYTDYLKAKKEYDTQRILEKYQATRDLPRPKTKWVHIVLYAVLYSFFMASAFLLFNLINIPTVRVFVDILFPILFSEAYLRFLCIKIVECYQHYAKEETRRRCLCIPSCSEYAILCLKKYELIFALFKIRKRLYKTCKGDIYVLDFPYKNGNKDVLK